MGSQDLAFFIVMTLHLFVCHMLSTYLFRMGCVKWLKLNRATFKWDNSQVPVYFSFSFLASLVLVAVLEIIIADRVDPAEYVLGVAGLTVIGVVGYWVNWLEFKKFGLLFPFSATGVYLLTVIITGAWFILLLNMLTR